MPQIIRVPGPRGRDLATLRSDQHGRLMGIVDPPTLTVVSVVGTLVELAASTGYAEYDFVLGDGHRVTQTGASLIYDYEGMVPGQTRIAYVRGKDSTYGAFSRISSPVTITF